MPPCLSYYVTGMSIVASQLPFRGKPYRCISSVLPGKTKLDIRDCLPCFQVGCPLPGHLNSGVTNEQTVKVLNHMTCYLVVHVRPPVLFSDWSVSKSNVQEVDKQPEKHGNLEESTSEDDTRLWNCCT